MLEQSKAAMTATAASARLRSSDAGDPGKAKRSKRRRSDHVESWAHKRQNRNRQTHDTTTSKHKRRSGSGAVTCSCCRPAATATVLVPGGTVLDTPEKNMLVNGADRSIMVPKHSRTRSHQEFRLRVEMIRFVQ